jgi:prophage antirepressor-like protein
MIKTQKVIKENQIGFSDEFSYNNMPIKYEITTDNKLQFFVEDCAYALGVTQAKTLKDDSESITIRWERVYNDLIGIERIPNSGDFKNLDADVKKNIRNEMKKMTITESQLYLWSFRVDSEQGKDFRDWLATTVLPNLREHGIYVTGMENMTPDEIKRVTDERIESYILRKFGIGVRKELTDTIKKVLNPAPYEGWKYAKYMNIVYSVLFGMECKDYKLTRGLADNDSLRDDMKEKGEGKLLDLIAKTEDFMGSLIMAGITDFNMLENLINNWYNKFSA